MFILRELIAAFADVFILLALVPGAHWWAAEVNGSGEDGAVN